MFKSKVTKAAVMVSIVAFGFLGTGCDEAVDNYYTGSVKVEKSFGYKKRCHVKGTTDDGQVQNVRVGRHLLCNFKNGETITLKDGNYVG